MKATGIVRRIDDLGRVVIPKEIRRTLRIHEGDPLEIFTDPNGEVVFKKYSPVGEMSEFASQYADVLSKTAAMPTLICDKDHIIATGGVSKKEFLERRVTPAIEDLMEGRKSFAAKNKEQAILPVEGLDKKASVAYPIIASGDVSGAVIMLKDDENLTAPSDTQVKLIQTAAAFLGKQLEE